MTAGQKVKIWAAGIAAAGVIIAALVTGLFGLIHSDPQISQHSGDSGGVNQACTSKSSCSAGGK